MGGGTGRNGVGTFLHWRNQNISLFSNSKLFKFFKKSMKNLYSLIILMEILRFFEKPLKFSRNFREDFGQISETFGNMHLYLE